MAAPSAVDYLAVGHVSADVRNDGDPALGGSVSYAARAAAALGLRAGIVTRAEPGFAARSAGPGIALRVAASAVTTTFANHYDGTGARTQKLAALAGPLVAADIPAAWQRVPILHVAPVAREVSAATVAGVRADFIGLTPQGWLRRLEVGAPVTPAPWSVPHELVARTDAVVLSDEDLAAVPDWADWLPGRTSVLVVTNSRRGARAYAGGRVIDQPALPAVVVDPTGAGDVFAAALFVELHAGRDVPVAMRFAAAAASCAIEDQGLRGIRDRAEIEGRLARLGPGAGASWAARSDTEPGSGIGY